ncbi:Uncharacterised protein [Mycobacteroides abscessus subsp. massiliense]|uniref:Tox-REase-5 domain-containing protein n=1 Tax=Mycobacteroides abscessus TaxID=36809 RepID=UPI0009A6FF74|nr:Tox-REase-5 domain-containing protein [Mycobacteroides abscessus]SKU12219.1 Uncharacterised protein [Mycobacteroides abscessus subsp. massiliense]
MLATDVNSYREALDPAAKLMAQLEDRTHDFKGYVERPGGSTWSGLWASASQEKADGAWRTVVHARDAMDESARAMLNTIDYDIIPPLNNAKAILNNVHGQPGVTVNDAECTLSYTAPEGMSKELADKNAKIVADASRELKDSATKWWAGVEKLKGQADAAGNTVAGQFNLAAAMFNVNKAVADTKPKDVPAATPDDNFYKDWYPKATPASTEAAAATAPVNPNAPVLGPPTPEKSVDPSKLGSIGGTVDYLNKNATPPAPSKPEPPKKGFLDGWVDAAKQKAEGIVDHAGDMIGLHGSEKFKDAWIDTGIGLAKDALDEATGNPGHVPSALDQTIDAYNKAEYAKTHGGSAASLAGAGLFDIQAKSAEATAAIATGGTGRFLERGVVEGALGAEGRAALHEGIPTLDNTLHNTVKGFLNDALHPETPAAPHIETPAVPRAEIPTAPHVEEPAVSHAEPPSGGGHVGEDAPGHHAPPAVEHSAPHVDHSPSSSPPSVVEHPADTFDPHQGRHYTSGDPHYPGGWPPGTPESTWAKGDTDPGWHHINRGERPWMPYQEQISGAERLPDGRIPEYAQLNPDTGKMVNFDGHTYRGDQEVFLDAKDGYAKLATEPGKPWTNGMTDGLLKEVESQLGALPDGARLEIHVSDPTGAAAIRKLLSDNFIYGAQVIYTPKAP